MSAVEKRTNVININSLVIFTTRVLIWQDKKSKQPCFIAQSLETGRVTTAPHKKAIVNHILNALAADFNSVHQASDPQPLFTDPAPYGLWMYWVDMAHKGHTIEDHYVQVDKGIKALVRVIYDET